MYLKVVPGGGIGAGGHVTEPHPAAPAQLSQLSMHLNSMHVSPANHQQAPPPSHVSSFMANVFR